MGGRCCAGFTLSASSMNLSQNPEDLPTQSYEEMYQERETEEDRERQRERETEREREKWGGGGGLHRYNGWERP